MDDRSPPYGPITTAATVTLQEPLALDAVAAASLLFRKVNVKEAFTLLGPDGQWYRCALQALDASGATALPYERMASSPESSARITLVVAVLQRQRMLVVAQSQDDAWDAEWQRQDNYQDPRLFYAANTRGWVLANDGATPELLAAHVAKGAALYAVCGPTPSTLEGWLAAHARVVHHDEHGTIYALDGAPSSGPSAP